MQSDVFWHYIEALGQILDSAHNGVVIVDNDGSIRLFNQMARKVLATRKLRIIGQHITSVSSEEAWRDMRRILKTGQPQVNKTITIGESTIIANRSPLIIEDEIIGVLSIFQDISEYEKISSELDSFKQLSMQLDAIIESSYDGLYITDGSATTLRVNHAYERISGLRREDLVGRNMKELVQEGLIDKSVTLEVLRRQEPVTIMQDIAGGRHVIVTGNPIYDKQGKISIVVTNVRDITELNQLRLELEETRKLSSRYQEELEELQKLAVVSDELIAKSKPFRTILKQAIKVSQVDATVLITGESGVGKSLLARIIHKISRRNEKPFIKISCGAIPEPLLESELFGYEKGAFTGARPEGKAGLFEIASKGTVFLDEIGELPLNLQVKLLDALEDKEICRVGGTAPVPVDFRLLAATKRDLKQMVKVGNFREDLFFRLSVIPLHIPPLRERKEAIIPLIDHFLQKTIKTTGKTKVIAPEAYEQLTRYPFFGNVRELRNLVERTLILSDNNVIRIEDLPSIPKAEPSFFYREKSDTPPTLKQALAKFEAKIIEDAVATCGTFSKAAKMLGVNQSTISRKVKKYKCNTA